MGDGGGPISSMLADKIVDRFEKKEQSILFLNRRGFASILFAKNAVMLRPANIVAYQ